MFVVSAGLAIYWGERLLPLAVAAVAAVVVYPLVWYLLHRFVLHGRYLYKLPQTAAVWKRIHFDHHQDPNDLGVLFGALYTTLPTIVIVTVPIGWAIGGPAGAWARRSFFSMVGTNRIRTALRSKAGPSVFLFINH